MSKSEEEKEQRNIILILVGLTISSIIILSFIPTDSPDNLQDQSKENLAKFEIELAHVGTSLTMYKIINRNDYDWHNIEITVNEYYSCWSREILKSGESITINAVTCRDLAVNHNMIESMWVSSEEGSQRYSLK